MNEPFRFLSARAFPAQATPSPSPRDESEGAVAVLESFAATEEDAVVFNDEELPPAVASLPRDTLVADVWDKRRCALRPDWESAAETIKFSGKDWQAGIRVEGSTITARGADRRQAIRRLKSILVDHLTEPSR